jgi:hypothetical protein
VDRRLIIIADVLKIKIKEIIIYNIINNTYLLAINTD